ncbi:MAG: hypothetical protein NVSMB38_40900 [Ktedonobacteraceae bacterium]
MRAILSEQLQRHPQRMWSAVLTVTFNPYAAEVARLTRILRTGRTGKHFT